MKEFTSDTFRKIIRIIDDENNYDFETFIDGLNEKFGLLEESDIDEIIEFLQDQFGIAHDSDVCNMSPSEVDDLCDFINHIVANLDEDEDSY